MNSDVRLWSEPQLSPARISEPRSRQHLQSRSYLFSLAQDFKTLI